MIKHFEYSPNQFLKFKEDVMHQVFKFLEYPQWISNDFFKVIELGVKFASSIGWVKF